MKIMRMRRTPLCLIGCLLAWPGVGGAATIHIGSADGARGDAVVVEVTLDTEGDALVAVENVISFEALAPVLSCARNDALGKDDTTFFFQPEACSPGGDCESVKAMVVSLSSLDPIPDGSVLYTCTVPIDEDATPGSEVPLACLGPLGSSISGEEMYVSCTNGAIRVASSSPSPTPTITATATPTATESPDGGTNIVSGAIRYYRNERPVADVSVVMSGAVPGAVQTNAAGGYAFASVSDGAYEIAPSKAGDLGSGVSALDAAYVLQAIVQKRSFDEYEELACDVTGNGTLSSLDAARILQFVVNKLNRFAVAEACGSDWAFLPTPESVSNQTVIEPLMSTGSCQPGAIRYDLLTDSPGNQDFHAVLFGDCTGNWEPSAGGGGAGVSARAGTGPVVRAGRLRRVRRRAVHLPISVESAEPFHALHMQVAFDPAELEFNRVLGKTIPETALVAANAEVSGVAAIAVASGESMAGDGHKTLLLEFKRLRRGSRAGIVQVLAASVDEQEALVKQGWGCACQRNGNARGRER